MLVLLPSKTYVRERIMGARVREEEEEKERIEGKGEKREGEAGEKVLMGA